MIKLYSYFRSSASYRVRIALNLKGLEYESVPVHLLHHGGEQFAPDFCVLNPQAMVPVLVHDGASITQSLAIIEYLEECYPTPPLLPVDALARAQVRQIAQTIACDIHPLNNLRVLRLLTQEMGVSEECKRQWIAHWIMRGFSALETQLSRAGVTGNFCYGATPSIADCCLIPQMFNARRFEIDMRAYPTLCRIEDACQQLAAFQAAAPAAQADAA